MVVKKKKLGSDRVIIDQLKVLCHIGVTKQERQTPQPVILTVTMEQSLKKAGLSDCLKDTLDYAPLVTGLTKLIEYQQFNLIERVAEVAARWILANSPVTVVRVQAMKKPFSHVNGVGVLIRRKKHEKK